jgi:predicted nucleic acid-binding protein
MYVLDTKAIIYHFKGEQKVEAFILDKFAGREVLVVPTIVVTEFLSYFEADETDVRRLKELLNYVEVSSLTLAIAELAGKLRKQFKMSLGDSVIAATAFSLGASLVTRNVKDFKKVKGLNIVAI